MDSHHLLAQEWQSLQHHHEQHEKNALLIKLAALGLCLLGLATDISSDWLALFVLLCWGQEGIFKTYQARLGARLLQLEQWLAGEPVPQATHLAHQPMQLHTQWQASRPGGFALLGSYATSALRPTVAFPYVPLLLALWLMA